MGTTAIRTFNGIKLRLTLKQNGVIVDPTPYLK